MGERDPHGRRDQQFHLEDEDDFIPLIQGGSSSGEELEIINFRPHNPNPLENIPDIHQWRQQNPPPISSSSSSEEIIVPLIDLPVYENIDFDYHPNQLIFRPEANINELNEQQLYHEIIRKEDRNRNLIQQKFITLADQIGDDNLAKNNLAHQLELYLHHWMFRYNRFSSRIYLQYLNQFEFFLLNLNENLNMGNLILEERENFNRRNVEKLDQICYQFFRRRERNRERQLMLQEQQQLAINLARRLEHQRRRLEIDDRRRRIERDPERIYQNRREQNRREPDRRDRANNNNRFNIRHLR